MLSRVADSLYWLSRYLERAEHTARLLDVNLDETLDQNPAAASLRWRLLLQSLQVDPAALGGADEPLEVNPLVKFLAVDGSNPVSIAACIGTARENARQIREQISSEMWLQINRLYQHVRGTTLRTFWRNSPHDFLQRVVKEGVHMFQGVTDATMSHGEGWHFLQLGRYVERAQGTTGLLKAHFPHNSSEFYSESVENDLEWIALLKSCTSFEAYCKVYTVTIRPDWVAEFLLLNRESPRSVRFATDRILDSSRAIALLTGKMSRDSVSRFAGRLSSLLDYASVEEILADGLPETCEEVQKQCARIHQEIYERYIQPREILLS